MTDRILLLISNIKLGESGLAATFQNSIPNMEIINTRKLGKDIMLELHQA